MHALFKTTIEAIRSFFFENTDEAATGPQIRDSYDVKRMMMLVVYALLPCTIAAIINTGLQAHIFNSFNGQLFLSYTQASTSFISLFHFILIHIWPILTAGLKIVLPSLILVYLTGGFVEIIFASVHKKPLSEGFLVTGLLITLILPPTLPYWMIIIGTAIGLILGKELFGGTGMNILNPALVCRCFLFFTFPAYMSGEVWVGTTSYKARKSIVEIKKTTSSPYATGQTLLAVASAPSQVRRIHIEAMNLARGYPSFFRKTIVNLLHQYDPSLSIDSLSETELLQFVTAQKGLMLDQEFYPQAMTFSYLSTGEGNWSDQNLFIGNQLGSLGETSTFACLLGALFLLVCGIASWRIMLGVLIGAYVTSLLFQYGTYLAPYHGLFLPAHYSFPAYKQLLLGGLAFGLVFMATDPVSSPTLSSARWAYGLLIGILTIVIRVVNPAFAEGVMLAILFGNVFAPLFDRLALNVFTRREQKRLERFINESP